MSNDQNWPVDDGQFPMETVYDLLAPRRRRQLLYCLYMYATPMGLPDVAGRIAQWEHDGSETEVLEGRLRVYNSLYHTHVPKLAEVGVVAHDQSEDVVDLGPNASHLRPYLEQAAEKDLETSETSL